jgi:hypothetical protein
MLSWLFGNKKQTLVATIDNGGGKSEDGHDHQCTAHLILEDDNPHDNQAVRVDISGYTVGYLSRKNARAYLLPNALR